MPMNEKLRVLSALVVCGGALLLGGVGHAANDTFEGTWVGGYGGILLRIELHSEGDGLVASASMLITGLGSLPFDVTKVEQAGDTLTLDLSGQGMAQVSDEIKIELRVSNDELVGKMFFEQGAQDVPLRMMQMAPNTAARFAEAKPLLPGILMLQLTEANYKRQREICAKRLEQLGLVMKMFAIGHRWDFFPRSVRLKISREDVYPEYLPNLNLLICPADEVAPEKGMPEEDKAQWYFDHSRYWYIGHAVTNQEHALSYLEAYRKVIQSGGDSLDDIVKPFSEDQDWFYRLREGIDRYFYDDRKPSSQNARLLKSMPVLIERPGTHGPDRCHVLFMDGHVEYLRLGGIPKFPTIKLLIEGLASLDTLIANR